ncbi:MULTISPECIES: hypothetical protein [Paraclostridium]|uniref:hypothetical protein n=1 Tax=Paraclostridium TaxID=1849822 RepID=UPI0021DFE208|nr:hypothetical protein [Paraclostridium sp. AKS73]MCU9816475.1 hypothetical protein [Paraclostridium sp. AKS73]
MIKLMLLTILTHIILFILNEISTYLFSINMRRSFLISLSLIIAYIIYYNF